MRYTRIVVACLIVQLSACATPYFPEKTQRDRDIEQCAYGAVVPHNITQAQRHHYIYEVSVPACLKAKGYKDSVVQE